MSRIDKKQERKHMASLTLLFSSVVFFVLVWAVLLAALAVYLLVHFNVIGDVENTSLGGIILFMVLISSVMGMAISFLTIKIPLKPINKWVSNMRRLASGDFRVRMRISKPLDNMPVFSELIGSFNTLAEELQNTEMLRSDFINNFSHEFKTPIVSIAGFAKLLKRDNLTEEQRLQYLDAIEQESLRLSYMATNILNLTKVENQTILTNVTRYNLSEQLRSSVLLLESKWSKKDLTLQLDFDEHYICADEELLKQIWINLIDNAIKFVSPGGTVTVDIAEGEKSLLVAVSNTGSEIPREKQSKIFNKFYQADESHASEGSGIGLAIVKRITELHKGSISLVSGNGETTFTIELPRHHEM